MYVKDKGDHVSK